VRKHNPQSRIETKCGYRLLIDEIYIVGEREIENEEKNPSPSFSDVYIYIYKTLTGPIIHLSQNVC
jgi:hypothetical protein